MIWFKQRVRNWLSILKTGTGLSDTDIASFPPKMLLKGQTVLVHHATNVTFQVSFGRMHSGQVASH